MLQISFIFAILIAIVAVVFVFLKIGKFKTFANNSILFIGIVFVFGVVMFGFFYGSTHVTMTPIEMTYNSFYSAIKMFALGNGSDIFKSAINEETKEVIVAYPSILDWDVEFVSLVLIRYVAQISALVVVSGAVISKVIKELKLGFVGFWVGFKHFFSFHKKSYTRNIVYTDLEYENLKPFLENLRNDPKAVNKVVILKTSATTQHGQELAEIIKLLNIQVVNEGLDFRALKKFCMLHKTWKINFYSLMENDIDNLSFAEVALKFYEKKVKEKGILQNDFYKIHKEEKLKKEADDYKKTVDALEKMLKEDPENKGLENDLKEITAKKNKVDKALMTRKRRDRYDVNFYISFQNESFNNKTNFYRMSNGHIKLVSEYDTVASKFVFENPVTRFLYEPGVDVKKKLNEENDLNIHFVGFGGINQAIAVKMIPNYQLPKDDIQVKYEILSDGASEKTALEFLSKFQALSGVYSKNKEEYLPQRDFKKFVTARSFNAFNDDEVYDTAYRIVQSIINSKASSPRHVILIALGNAQTNVDVALKLRTQIRNIAKTLDKDILKPNSHKPVLIYPYVKDNNFFKQPTSLFERVTKAVIDYKKFNEDNSEITKENYSKVFSDFSKGDNKAYYNNDLSFVFETNYCKNSIVPDKDKLKKLGITRSLWYKYFDYFHDVSFGFEELPIINFGRGGYIADPSYEAIVTLAKYVNRHFGGLNLYEMEEDWIKQNYQNQQSNIGTVLSFPMKANVLGFKLAYDGSNAFDDYVYFKGKTRCQIGFRNRAYKLAKEVYESCFEKYIDACDFLENTRKVDGFYDILDRAAGYTIDFEKYLAKNPDKVCELLGIKPAKQISLEEVKAKFAEKYDGCLKDYYKYVDELAKIPNDDENKEKIAQFKTKNDKVISAMEDAINAYYNLVCKSLLNDEFKIIRNIEHNRWYFDKTFNGVVPRNLNTLTGDYSKNKSVDGLRHLCMTTNDGLDILEEKVIRKIAEDGFYILAKVDENMPKYPQKRVHIASFKELPFNEKESQKVNPLIRNVYYTNYFSDVFQYEVLVTYIIDNYIKIKESHSSTSNYNFLLRFLDETTFESDKKELEVLLKK